MGYPVDKLECWASFPAKRVLHMVTDHPADDVSVNILAQWSVVSRDVSMALPTPSPPTLVSRGYGGRGEEREEDPLSYSWHTDIT